MSKTLIPLIAALAASPAFAQSIFDPMPTATHNYIGRERRPIDVPHRLLGPLPLRQEGHRVEGLRRHGRERRPRVELGYTDFGKINANGGDIEAWAGTLSITAGFPVGDRFKVFAKGGGLYGRTDVRSSPTTLFDSGHKDGWGYTYGVGAALGVTRTVQVRLDWDRHNMDFVGGSKDVDMWSAGVQLRF